MASTPAGRANWEGRPVLALAALVEAGSGSTDTKNVFCLTAVTELGWLKLNSARGATGAYFLLLLKCLGRRLAGLKALNLATVEFIASIYNVIVVKKYSASVEITGLSPSEKGIAGHNAKRTTNG